MYYKEPEFASFVENSIQALKEFDSVSFARVKGRVKGVVELGQQDYWVGRVIGVYFDGFSKEERERAGHRRYAAHIVRFAIDVRLLQGFGILDTIRFKSRRHIRVAKISVRRELSCCEKIGCEMKHIYNIQRWLRANDT